MKLYNTATAASETMKWNTTVSLYVCGITPYDAAHMGHILTFVTYDILQRYLEYQGHTVHLVRNITDVDEPIYVKAAELKIPYTQLASEETAKFKAVLQQLNFKTPFAEPLASDYIGEMSSAVQQLVASGHGYRLPNGDYYFDVTTFKDFGKQTGFSDQLQLAFMADRGGDPERTDKRNPLDFLLWRALPDVTDPARWESPLGTGRPGWHIECSVMSSQLLKLPIDIHGGGMDLIFPHHAAETAQSESLTGGWFVKHWMHVAPLYYHGEKMSKSLGNLVFAKDLLTQYEPAAVRLAALQYHYQIGGEWHNDAVATASQQLVKIRQALEKATGPDPAPYLERFFEALDDDLDIPEALHVINQFSCCIVLKGGDSTASQAGLKQMLDILGISL